MRRLIATCCLLALGGCGDAAAQRQTHQAQALIASHCAACHRVPGIAVATGRVGPSLQHIGSQQIIAGYFVNSPANLAQWIEHPQKLLPGNAMPEMGLSADEAAQITDYLYTMN
jgi:cytochrome c1